MAWDDIITKIDCWFCGKAFLWKPGNTCECPECSVSTKPPVPNVPAALYIGPEKLRRIKISPLPPTKVVYEGIGEYHQSYREDCTSCVFACRGRGFEDTSMDCGFTRPDDMQPYSVRSFLVQLSLRRDFPCKYFVRTVGADDFGNISRQEGCMESCGGSPQSSLHPCHLANGWMHGIESCAGWEYIKKLCQSENEVRFLHQYLRINKDREFPMPIPQAYVEVAEIARVDFVLFVPITRFKWKWWAIEIDSKEYHSDWEKDLERSVTIASEGYEVIRLSAEKKMLDQVRDLYRRITEVQNGIKTPKS